MVIKAKNISKLGGAEHAQFAARVGGSECKRVRRGSSSRLAVPSPAQSRREGHATLGVPSINKKRRPPTGLALHGTRAARPVPPPPPPPLVVCATSPHNAGFSGLSIVQVSSDPVSDAAAEEYDVIDLGAPRHLRRAPAEPLRAAPRHTAPAAYTPNPRLYPGTRPKPKPRKTPGANEQHSEYKGRELHGRRSKRVFRRPVPNARLYRPVAPRAPPSPPPRPYRTWPPPGQQPRTLDTASHVALRFAEQRRAQRVPERPPSTPGPPIKARGKSPGETRSPALSPVRSPQRSRRLVVTLPAAAAGDGPPRYHPTSGHFKLRDLDLSSGVSTPPAARARSPATTSVMDPANRHSTSPEDCSDGNETLSAPSEFLAEFLSAIMGRQYAEALKYCRLILQYEPHNATARGFYPLLQHKVLTHAEPGPTVAGPAECPRDSSSESAKSGRARRTPREPRAPRSPPTNEDVMEQEADDSPFEGYSRSHTRSHSSGSCGSQSSLELDSSEPLQQSSGSHSLSLSRRTDHTESGASGGSGVSGGSGGSGASGASGVSGARCSSAATDTDDNGNAPTAAAAATAAASLRPGDLENDNAAAASGEPHHHLKRESSSLRRLRAQFACSIK